MHDIRTIRDDPAAFDRALARRGGAPVATHLLNLDAIRRSSILEAETRSSESNRLSKEAGAAKASGDDAAFNEKRRVVGALKAEIAAAEERAKGADAALQQALLAIPNLPDADVPDGADEGDNVELRRWGKPPAFDFAPREHYALPGVIPGMDFATGAKLSGARFVVLRAAVARIHRALAQFMLDTHVSENGLEEVNGPVLVRDAAMYGTGQLPKFADDSFVGDWFSGRAERLRNALAYQLPNDLERLTGGEPFADVVEEILERAPTSEGYWLIPTSEVTLTNSVAGDVLDEDALPIRMVSHSLCFRSEAGSAGRDTAGMLRQHQFEKVEMVSITHPGRSREELDRMTGLAEGILERLGLAYRTIVLCTGDMGFGARRTHDIEVWLPGQDRYREISSCSTTGDFQARRMNARFRPSGGGKPDFVHSLNGSGLAVGRCLIAVLENGQQADGSVALPEVLSPWLGGKLTLTAEGGLV